MGFGGVFLHSRTGLETEYLSDEWMDITNYCAELLKQENMSAWLYDEDRWPSGTCSGSVTRDPHYRLKFMGMKMFPAEKFDMADFGQEFLAAFAVDLCGTPWCDLPGDIDPHAGMELAGYKKYSEQKISRKVGSPQYSISKRVPARKCTMDSLIWIH